MRLRQLKPDCEEDDTKHESPQGQKPPVPAQERTSSHPFHLAGTFHRSTHDVIVIQQRKLHKTPAALDGRGLMTQDAGETYERLFFLPGIHPEPVGSGYGHEVLQLSAVE